MTDSEQKILDIIRETLPEKEVGIVRDIFNENAQLKEQNKIMKDDLDHFHERLESASKYIKQLEDETISARQQMIENERERNILEKDKKIFSEEQMKLKVDIAEAKLNSYREAMGMVFKVPEVRKNFYKTIPVEVNGYIQNGSESGSETTTEE